jgi:conjugative transfer signal peptidase TraF
LHCLRHVKRRFRHHPVLTIGLGATLLVGIASSLFADRQLVVNTSSSVAPGLYMRSSASPAVGCIIDFRIPELARGYVQARTGHCGADWYILKPVAAGPGDLVDTSGAALFINGREIAPMPPERDAAGRTLPVWRGACVLGPDEFFAFSDRIPNSFDSRCYGPIRRAQIAAVRKPLVTW